MFIGVHSQRDSDSSNACFLILDLLTLIFQTHTEHMVFQWAAEVMVFLNEEPMPAEHHQVCLNSLNGPFALGPDAAAHTYLCGTLGVIFCKSVFVFFKKPVSESGQRHIAHALAAPQQSNCWWTRRITSGLTDRWIGWLLKLSWWADVPPPLLISVLLRGNSPHFFLEYVQFHNVYPEYCFSTNKSGVCAPPKLTKKELKWTAGVLVVTHISIHSPALGEKCHCRNRNQARSEVCEGGIQVAHRLAASSRTKSNLGWWHGEY